LAWIPYYVLYSVYSRAIIHKHWTSRNRPLTCPWLPRDELGQLGLKNCSLPYQFLPVQNAPRCHRWSTHSPPNVRMMDWDLRTL
jgi:hypothetical protein